MYCPYINFHKNTKKIIISVKIVEWTLSDVKNSATKIPEGRPGYLYTIKSITTVKIHFLDTD